MWCSCWNMKQLLGGSHCIIRTTWTYRPSWLMKVKYGKCSLISSSMRFKRNATVVAWRVSAHYAPDAAQIHLLVQDNGPGIAPELLEKIWRPFFTTKTAGIGLGLAIVRRIVWEHGGDIACTSAEGQGTGFHIVLPVTDTSASRATPAQG